MNTPSNPKASGKDVLNKTAVALFYDQVNTPQVSAKGQDELAEAIIALATAYEVPVFENPGLAAFLDTVEIGEEIPRILYETVAEIIAFAYQLSGKSPNQ